MPGRRCFQRAHPGAVGRCAGAGAQWPRPLRSVRARAGRRVGQTEDCGAGASFINRSLYRPSTLYDKKMPSPQFHLPATSDHTQARSGIWQVLADVLVSGRFSRVCNSIVLLCQNWSCFLPFCSPFQPLCLLPSPTSHGIGWGRMMGGRPPAWL